MRRVSRIDRSISLLRIPRAANTHYICSACNHQASSFSSSTLRAARTDKKLPLTEKVRQRIWGTDKPPGAKDPYGDASIFDQTKKEPQQSEPEAEEELDTEEALSSGPKPDWSTYEPATVDTGLEKVGYLGNRGYAHRFQGFLPIKRVTDDDDIARALHRALVEVFALPQAGRPLSEISSGQLGVDETLEVRITPSESGASLSFSGSASLERVVESLARVDEAPTESEADVSADRSSVDPLDDSPLETSVDETVLKADPTESEEDVAADRSFVDPLNADPAWVDVSVENLEVKLAVLKRTMQLTGIRVPDHVLQSVKTAGELLRYLVTPPKARKLVEDLEQNEQLMSTPNITVFAKRVTSIDKEIMVGRWKVIEEELKKRELPLPRRRKERIVQEAKG